MSMGDCEQADVYIARRVVARKPHKCCACDELINIGDEYHKVNVVWEHTASTYKRCLRCQAIHAHLVGIMQQGEWPDEELKCGHDYADEFGDIPSDIAELAFLTPDQAQVKFRADKSKIGDK